MITDIAGYCCRCDVCGAFGPVVEWTLERAGTLGDEVREAATSQGWECKGERWGATFGRDLCPEHRTATPYETLP